MKLNQPSEFTAEGRAYIKLQAHCRELQDEVARLQSLINTPHTADFMQSVRLEAIHQRERWGVEHDAGKEDSDWFWLIGYLAGKAIRPDATPEKRLHHIITTAAACLNWHAARSGVDTRMRPGISHRMCNCPPSKADPTRPNCQAAVAGEPWCRASAETSEHHHYWRPVHGGFDYVCSCGATLPADQV